MKFKHGGSGFVEVRDVEVRRDTTEKLVELAVSGGRMHAIGTAHLDATQARSLALKLLIAADRLDRLTGGSVPADSENARRKQ